MKCIEDHVFFDEEVLTSQPCGVMFFHNLRRGPNGREKRLVGADRYRQGQMVDIDGVPHAARRGEMCTNLAGQGDMLPNGIMKDVSHVRLDVLDRATMQGACATIASYGGMLSNPLSRAERAPLSCLVGVSMLPQQASAVDEDEDDDPAEAWKGVQRSEGEGSGRLRIMPLEAMLWVVTLPPDQVGWLAGARARLSLIGSCWFGRPFETGEAEA